MLKKITITMAMALLLIFTIQNSASAYSITDPSNDGIGSYLGFESYGINVYNFTPGINSGAISFDLFTDYPQAGILVGSWDTEAADLFITETYYGEQYLWGIPLVSHDGLSAGTMYAVASTIISDSFAPSSGYIYNHNVPVRIGSVGNNYGYSSFGGGSVAWIANSGSPDWTVSISTGIWEDDPNGSFSYLWGTATCGNDVIQGAPVPEPATMLLLGSGLVGLAGFGRRKFLKKG